MKWFLCVCIAMTATTTTESDSKDKNNPKINIVAWPTQNDLAVVDDNNSCCIPVSTTIASCCYGVVVGWCLPANCDGYVYGNSVVCLGTIPIDPLDLSDGLTSLDDLKNQVHAIQSKLKTLYCQDHARTGTINTWSESYQSNNNTQSRRERSDSDIRKICYHDNSIQVVALAVRLTNEKRRNASTLFVRHKDVFDEYRSFFPDINIIFISPRTATSAIGRTIYNSIADDDVTYYPIWFDDYTINQEIVSKRQILFYYSTSNIRTDEKACLYQYGNSYAFNNQFLFILTHAGVVWDDVILHLNSVNTESQVMRYGRRCNLTTNDSNNGSRFFTISKMLQQHSTFFHHVFTTVPAVRYWKSEKKVSIDGSTLSKVIGDPLQESHYEYVSRVTFESNERIKRVLDLLLVLIIVLTIFCFWYSSDTLQSTSDLMHKQRLLLYSGVSWLENHPIGFKLNESLTKRFGVLIRSSFWMHDYTCRSLFTFLFGPLGVRITLSMAFCSMGILHGGSSILALMFDVGRGLILPVTAFASIFRSLLSTELYLLSASWILFRGKKRNILRQRTDTLEYESMQLLVGTIMFATTLFLLTTIFVYYVFFMTLAIGYHGILSVLFLFPLRIIYFFPFGELLWRWKRRGWYSHEVMVIDRSPIVDDWKPSVTALKLRPQKLSTTATELLYKNLIPCWR